MNRVQPVIIFPIETPTKEEAGFIFISRRLKELTIRKLEKGEWDFQYLSLKPHGLGKFTAELISPATGVIILTRDKK